jgi:hypothetical protein
MAATAAPYTRPNSSKDSSAPRRIARFARLVGRLWARQVSLIPSGLDARRSSGSLWSLRAVELRDEPGAVHGACHLRAALRTCVQEASLAPRLGYGIDLLCGRWQIISANRNVSTATIRSCRCCYCARELSAIMNARS